MKFHLYKSSTFATKSIVSELPLQIHHEEGVLRSKLSGSIFARLPLEIYSKSIDEKIATVTLYIDGMIVFDKIRTLRYNGEGESVLHLMSENMVGRVDPHPNALFHNSYGIVNLLMEGRVCMCKVDSSKACIGNDFY